jgi:hypothetical protein
MRFVENSFKGISDYFTLFADVEFWSILSSFVERFSAAQRALLDERKVKNEREARRK